nr:MAG TPA: hypothetical protein [Caudoviricetes sp.]
MRGYTSDTPSGWSRATCSWQMEATARHKSYIRSSPTSLMPS